MPDDPVLAEAKRRGLIPSDDDPVLAEAKRRGLIPAAGAATPSAAPAPSLVPPPSGHERAPEPMSPNMQRFGTEYVPEPTPNQRFNRRIESDMELDRQHAENEQMAAQGYKALGGGTQRRFVPMNSFEMGLSAMGSAIRQPMREGWEKAGKALDEGNATGTLRGLIQSGVGAITAPFAPAAATSQAIKAADADPSLPKVGALGRTLGVIGEAPAAIFKPIAMAKEKLAEAQAAAEATGYPGLAKTMEVAGLGADVGELYLGAKIPAMERAVGGRVSRFAQDYAAAKALRAEAAPVIPERAPTVGRASPGPAGEPLAVPPAEATPPVKPGAFGEPAGPRPGIALESVSQPKGYGFQPRPGGSMAEAPVAGEPSPARLRAALKPRTLRMLDRAGFTDPRQAIRAAQRGEQGIFQLVDEAAMNDAVGAYERLRAAPATPSSPSNASARLRASEPGATVIPSEPTPKSKFLLDYEKAREMVRPPVPAEAPAPRPGIDPVSQAPEPAPATGANGTVEVKYGNGGETQMRSGFSPEDLGLDNVREVAKKAKQALDDMDLPDPLTLARPQDREAFPRRSGIGGRQSGGAVDLTAVRDVARAGEGLLGRADAVISERVTKPGIDAILDRVPGARKLESLAFKTGPAAVGTQFDQVVTHKRRATTASLQNEAIEARSALRQAAKKAKLPDAVLEEIGKSLNSEPANLTAVPDHVLPLIEAVRKAGQDLRSLAVQEGLRTEATFGEYPQGRLSNILKDDTLLQRSRESRAGVRIGKEFIASDMPSVNPKMSEAEIRALIPEGAPVRSINPQGGRTLVKFANTPEGLAARDALRRNIETRMSERKANIESLATEAIRRGDVVEAKRLMRRVEQMPSASDLDLQVRDAVAPEVAKQIFNQDIFDRMEATHSADARNIANARTLREIPNLVDEKGRRIALEPESRDAARLGKERPPDGYEVLSGEKFGELDGMFVEKAAAKELRGVFSPEAEGFWKGFSEESISLFKQGKILFDPRQWFRQGPSNFEHLNYMGMSVGNPRFIQHALRGLKAMKKDSPFHRGLVEEGLFDPSQLSLSEIGAAEQALLRGRNPGRRFMNALATLGISEMAPSAVAKTKAIAGRGLGFFDTWAKAMGYVKAIVEDGMTSTEAATFVREWTHSSDNTSPLVKAYSNSIVGNPFARYPAGVARINLKGMREKPLRFAMNRLQTNALRAALAAAGVAVLSDDEKAALENEQGEGAVAVGRDEKLRPVAIDTSFLTTMGNFDERPETIGRPDKDLRETFFRETGVGNNPFFQFVAEQFSGRDRYGRDINRDGTMSGATAQALGSFYEKFLPSIALSGQQKIRASIKGEPYSPNAPIQTPEQAVLDVFFGFKLTPLDAQRALEKIARQGEFAMRDLETEFNKNLAEGRAIDEAEVRARANAIAEQFKKRADPLMRIREQQSGRGIPLETVK